MKLRITVPEYLWEQPARPSLEEGDQVSDGIYAVLEASRVMLDSRD